MGSGFRGNVVPLERRYRDDTGHILTGLKVSDITIVNHGKSNGKAHGK